MPQTKAAEKALRINERRRTINDRWRRKLRGSLKDMRLALAAGEKKAAETAYATAQKVIDRATRHHILHPRAAARKKSRLYQAIQKLSK